MLKAADAATLLANCLDRDLAGWRVLNEAELRAEWAKRRHIVGGIEGLVCVEGRDIALRVGVRARFPVEPARVFLADPAAIGRAAHVEADGYVCYADDEELARDPSDNRGDLETAVALAAKTLGDSISGRSRLDLLDEFEAYVARIPNREDGVLALVEPNEELREIIAQKSDDGSSYVLVADSARAVAEWASRRKAAPFTQRVALYVPLEPSVLSAPPLPEDLADPKKVVQVVGAHLSVPNAARLKRLKDRKHHEEFIVLGFPRPTLGHILVGVLFRGVKAGHPLRGGVASAPAIPVVLERAERSHVVPRGGASMSLAARSAVVIGCGAIGGHVALGLAFAGVGALTVVDDERLGVENTFRHVLGNSEVGNLKIEGLKREIERKVPYTKVTALKGVGDVLISTGKLDLKAFDVAVVCVGAPTTSLVINEMIWRSATQTPAIFSWLEPLGIGGHALLTHASSTRGCYRCLYEPEEGRALFTNRADLVAPGQSFTKDHLGCGGRFAPFGSIDARRTADLTIELATDHLSGRVRKHVIRSWKGDATALRSAGFRTSPRFELSAATLGEAELGPSACMVCAS